MTIDQTLSDDFQLIPESLIFLMSFRVIVKRLSYGITKTKLHLLNRKDKDHGIISTPDKEKVLYIEISAEKIKALLAQRVICAADVRCLDTNSKHCLRELCLATCLHKKQAYQPGHQLLEN